MAQTPEPLRTRYQQAMIKAATLIHGKGYSISTVELDLAYSFPELEELDLIRILERYRERLPPIERTTIPKTILDTLLAPDHHFRP